MRAEAQALLSAMRAVRRMHGKGEIGGVRTVKHLLDNEAVVKQFKSVSKWSAHNVNADASRDVPAPNATGKRSSGSYDVKHTTRPAQ